MTSINKNNSIVVWRIYFAYIIAIFHLLNSYGYGTSLYLATDFFFIVSGFLLAKEAEENKYESSIKMLISKVKKYYPHYILSMAISYMVFRILNCGPQLSIKEIIPEIGLIQMIGLNIKKMVNVPTWYLSVLLICSYIIYFLITNYKKIFVEFLSPIFVIVVLTWFYRNYGYISHSSLGDRTIGIYWNIPLVLGGCMMCIGVIIYYLIGAVNINVGGWKYCFAEIALLGSVPILACIYKYSEIDFVILLMMAVGIAFSFANKYSCNYNKYIRYFSKLSWPIYLNHNLFREIAPYYIKHFSAQLMIAYLVLITIYSMLTMLIVDKITQRKEVI